jgi:DNA-binding transcriptional LysR family regulator
MFIAWTDSTLRRGHGDGQFHEGSARAAVSQPALSASIAKLEKEHGVNLFHRSPKAVTLTPAGRRFHITAQEVLG